MDIAYDHVQEEALSPSEEHAQRAAADETSTNLNADLQQAFQAVSSSPWGSRLGGWFSQARKQGESFVSDLQKEAQDAQEQATQGWSSLREQVVQRTRGLSMSAEAAPEVRVPGEEAVPESKGIPSAEQAEAEALGGDAGEKPESLTADIVKEASTLVASLRFTAASRLKDLQKAEDAADEALLKFGSNIRNFLRDAVIISAPTDADTSKPKGTDAAGNEVLFETSEPGTGKKVFHSTRLDAQLHAIHTTASSFTEDPQGPQWDDWKTEFDVEHKTEDIAHDMDKYEELRRAMEKLVPEKVEYRLFWLRYYFLRKAIEEEERRRKEVLKGAASAPAEADVAWDDDDEDEAQSSTPNAVVTGAPSNNSTTTLNATTAPETDSTPPLVNTANDLLKPSKEPRRSNEDESRSVADSDVSYDIVSGATSRAAGSPKEEKRGVEKEESDDDRE
ncbi:hypothetical protein LTR91_006458 [Friedmanniomyces endolithicus]|uniref:BSD domain-containing protein n=1 Tax=Friedmanniomyces endolithicus TaxID=329885 RepID=A0AAN6QWU7_9PEZI|nr:hypothetical protein LTR57_011419 [Friedmanniomyces endolithicus]KAK0997995.1 hypothetical protein LTR91_006458 [Friedmanniomyces endolithicus]KAK1032289.1 hypothetical protein LTS16_017316 [Friedmanniomyces endolithicus]KAK1080356.1 hypothetical protein LTR33_005614 [Friedmanniomyces endolithicus]